MEKPIKKQYNSHKILCFVGKNDVTSRFDDDDLIFSQRFVHHLDSCGSFARNCVFFFLGGEP